MSNKIGFFPNIPYVTDCVNSNDGFGSDKHEGTTIRNKPCTFTPL